MMARAPRMIFLALCCLLSGAGSAHADGGWVLWARSCNLRSQACDGQWQQRQTYEAERWCRAARTTAINQALTPQGRQAARAKGAIVDYQCLPDTVDPRGGRVR